MSNQEEKKRLSTLAITSISLIGFIIIAAMLNSAINPPLLEPFKVESQEE